MVTQEGIRKVNLFSNCPFFISQCGMARARGEDELFYFFRTLKIEKKIGGCEAFAASGRDSPESFSTTSMMPYVRCMMEFRTGLGIENGAYPIGYDNHKQTKDSPKGNEQWTFWAGLPSRIHLSDVFVEIFLPGDEKHIKLESCADGRCTQTGIQCGCIESWLIKDGMIRVSFRIESK